METFIELYPYVSQHQNQFIIRNPAKETVFFGDKEFFVKLRYDLAIECDSFIKRHLLCERVSDNKRKQVPISLHKPLLHFFQVDVSLFGYMGLK
jgi:hypothetical protein